MLLFFFFFSSRRRHTRCSRDWSSDVCSSDLLWKLTELWKNPKTVFPQLLEPAVHSSHNAGCCWSFLKHNFSSTPPTRERQAGPCGVAERSVVPKKPGNSGGGKGPQLKTD